MSNTSLQTVFLTGASSGIGKALALEYAKKGFCLGLLARRGDLLEEVAKACLASGSPKVFIYVGSVTDDKFVKSAVDDFVAKVKHLDLVIANAGIGYPGIFLYQDWQEIQKTFHVNLFAPLKLLRFSTPHLQNNQGGQFAVISSMGAFRGAAFSASYVSSKAAVTAYFEGLRAEFKAENIKISIVFPGFVDTPMTQRNQFKMPFLLTKEKAAQIIFKKLKQKKPYVIFPKRLYVLVKIMAKLPSRLYDHFSLKFNSRDFYE